MRVSCLAFCNSRRKEDSLAKKTLLLKSVASKRPATESGCGGARNATHTLFQQPARQAARAPRDCLRPSRPFDAESTEPRAKPRRRRDRARMKKDCRKAQSHAARPAAEPQSDSRERP